MWVAWGVVWDGAGGLEWCRVVLCFVMCVCVCVVCVCVSGVCVGYVWYGIVNHKRKSRFKIGM